MGGRIINFTVTVLINLIFLPLIVIMTIAALIVSPVVFFSIRITTRLKTDQVARVLVWLYGQAWYIIVLPFVRFKKENISKDTIRSKSIFVVNHSSFFDTYCMGLLPLTNICFAVRSWPFKIFFYRPFMRLSRYIDVEGTPWRETLEIGKARLSEGCSLLFFPEGHRSRNGSLRRFYSDAFQLSIDSGAPMVPICLTGTEALLPPGRPWLGPARITIRALPPVDPKDFSQYQLPHVEMRKHVQNLMSTNLAEMRGLK